MKLARILICLIPLVVSAEEVLDLNSLPYFNKSVVSKAEKKPEAKDPLLDDSLAYEESDEAPIKPQKTPTKVTKAPEKKAAAPKAAEKKPATEGTSRFDRMYKNLSN